jgi:rod shape-determining protein MreD
MLTPAWQRFDNGARMVLPFVTTLMLCLLSSIRWPIPFLGTVAPPLALMAIYYWTVHRPDLFGSGGAFFIGLLHDVINNLPLGLSALLFVAAHQIILRQRRFFSGHSFFMLWVGFILTVTITMIIEEILLGVINWHGVPFRPVLMQIILAIVLFPLPCWLLIRLQRAALPQN